MSVASFTPFTLSCAPYPEIPITRATRWADTGSPVQSALAAAVLSGSVRSTSRIAAILARLGSKRMAILHSRFRPVGSLWRRSVIRRYGADRPAHHQLHVCSALRSLDTLRRSPDGELHMR